MKNQNKVLLNLDQVTDIAKKQSDVVTDLQMIQSLLFYMPETKNHIVDKQLNLIHAKIQQMFEVLDRTTVILYNADDKKEIEAMGVEVVD